MCVPPTLHAPTRAKRAAARRKVLKRCRFCARRGPAVTAVRTMRPQTVGHSSARPKMCAPTSSAQAQKRAASRRKASKRRRFRPRSRNRHPKIAAGQELNPPLPKQPKKGPLRSIHQAELNLARGARQSRLCDAACCFVFRSLKHGQARQRRVAVCGRAPMHVRVCDSLAPSHAELNLACGARESRFCVDRRPARARLKLVGVHAPWVMAGAHVHEVSHRLCMFGTVQNGCLNAPSHIFGVTGRID
jgi:hypothetical protein